jgi:hypothetical protein
MAPSQPGTILKAFFKESRVKGCAPYFSMAHP